MGYNEEIDAIKIQLENGTARIASEVSLAVLSAVTLSTPVGNPTLWQNPESAPPGYVGGNARGNWQVGIGQGPTGETKVKDKAGSATISKGRSALDGYKLGPRVFIVNNVPYIVRLNTGHSTQAPVGFIEKGIQAATNAFRNAKGPLG